jgi:ion channel-forming bestrophin family protein
MSLSSNNSSHHLSENPFQYDENDLDLDSFCRAIARELSEITAHPAPDPSEFVFSMWNQPFAPHDTRNAKMILDDEDHEYHHPTDGMDSIRRTMLKNWKAVHETTLGTKSK